MPKTKRGHGWTHKKATDWREPIEYSSPHTARDWYVITRRALSLCLDCKCLKYSHPDRDDFEEQCAETCRCSLWASLSRHVRVLMKQLKQRYKPDEVPDIEMSYSCAQLNMTILRNTTRPQLYSLLTRAINPEYPKHFI